ncbi:ribonuclease H-like domain-containing protein [Tanacetum coccineum]|uniref:Ribonuclease H-like domain-containing protein n=1 Tax=Tanacetum coccineum TaxID=301880 RepID=A0ABQ4Y2V1_9ASTR
MDVDNLVPIPRVSEKPLDSLDSILETSKTTITDPLFDFDSEFTLNLDNPILNIQNKESDESGTETIMDEVQINSTVMISLPLIDDESLSDEDIPKDKVKIYLNPLFKFDDEYISSDVNPLFDKVLEDIESKDSDVSNIDDPAMFVTPLSDANEDECFDPGGEIDEIDAFLDMDISTYIENSYNNSEGDIIYLESLLVDDIILNLPPEVLLDHDPKNLKDEPDNEDLKSMVKVFDPEIHEKTFSPTYVKLSFEDRHYLSLTYVTDISQKDKNKAKNEQNRARDWKSVRKAKPKAYSFLMGQPKIVSQLAILGENISQEDLNLKFLRSLPSEWNTHVVVWRNKPVLDTMSFDDLYNNFKIVEQEVKRTTSSSSQNMTFITASTQVSTTNLSGAIVYAFFANQPNGSQLVHEDLEQIHEDDLEEMDLKWQLSLLSMRTRRFFQKTGRKITINRSDTVGYDKSKVECFNCHKIGHFAREYRGPKNQDSRNRKQDSSRRTINVEETSSKAGAIIRAVLTGLYDNYEVPTNMAL